MYESVSGFCIDREDYTVQPCTVERVSDWLFFRLGERHSEREDGSLYVAKHYTPIALNIEFFYTKADALRSLVRLLDIEFRETRTKLNLLERVSRRVQDELEGAEAENAGER